MRVGSRTWPSLALTLASTLSAAPHVRHAHDSPAEWVLELLKARQVAYADVLRAVSGRQEVVYFSDAPAGLTLSPFQQQALLFARREADSPDVSMRCFAVIVLGRLGDKSDVDRVRRWGAAAGTNLRRSAMIALWRLDPGAGIAHCRELLGDPYWGIVRDALRIVAAKPGDTVLLTERVEARDEVASPVLVRAQPGGSAGVMATRHGMLPEAALIAAAMGLSGHQSPFVRCEAGLVLLRRRVATDYTSFVGTLETGSAYGLPVSDVVRVLHECWPRVPAEFYPVLKRKARGRGSNEAVDLIRRIDRTALSLSTLREAREFEELLRYPETVPPHAPAHHPGSTPGSRDRYALAFFHRQGCGDCQRAHKLLVEAMRDLPGLRVRRYNINAVDAAILNEIICERAGIPDRRRQVVPAIFSSRKGLIGKDIRPDSLRELVLSTRGLPPPWAIRGPDGESRTEAATERIKERRATMNALWFLGAGLADGINPCAFTVIIFLLSYLYHVGRGRRELLLAGLTFTLGVFATYLLVGFGVLEAVQALEFMPALSTAVYWATALLALTAGAMSLRDGVICLRGRPQSAWLQLPVRIRAAIHSVIRRQTRRHAIVVASLVTGFLVSLLELACTGQVYLPAIVLISKGAARATALLILYNVAFVTPLLFVFLMAYFGVSAGWLATHFRKHVAAPKFLLAAVFVGLFMLLIAMG